MHEQTRASDEKHETGPIFAHHSSFLFFRPLCAQVVYPFLRTDARIPNGATLAERSIAEHEVRSNIGVRRSVDQFIWLAPFSHSAHLALLLSFLFHSATQRRRQGQHLYRRRVSHCSRLNDNSHSRALMPSLLFVLFLTDSGPFGVGHLGAAVHRDAQRDDGRVPQARHGGGRRGEQRATERNASAMSSVRAE